MSLFSKLVTYITGVQEEREDMARIVVFDSGTTFLYNNGDIVGTYSRKRDAVRGAKRRGLIVA